MERALRRLTIRGVEGRTNGVPPRGVQTRFSSYFHLPLVIQPPPWDEIRVNSSKESKLRGDREKFVFVWVSGDINGGKRFLIREKFVKQRWIKMDDAYLERRRIFLDFVFFFR